MVLSWACLAGRLWYGSPAPLKNAVGATAGAGELSYELRGEDESE